MLAEYAAKFILRNTNVLELFMTASFDRIATSAVKRAKREYVQHRCDITRIMPYSDIKRKRRKLKVKANTRTAHRAVLCVWVGAVILLPLPV